LTQVNLVAMQVRAALEDYASGATFRRRMEGLMEKAAETVDFSKPSIVCFPETIGLWLSFHSRSLRRRLRVHDDSAGGNARDSR